jgi:hypothetical protein
MPDRIVLAIIRSPIYPVLTTAYCCTSASHISATIPNVTEPPAVDKPPKARPTRIVPKFGAIPTGICQIFTKNNDSCKIGHLPSSSDHGAHNSHPNAYVSRKIAAPNLAAWALTWNSPEIPGIALEYNDVLKFIDTWTINTTDRIIHFFHSGKEKPSSS